MCLNKLVSLNSYVNDITSDVKSQKFRLSHKIRDDCLSNSEIDKD